MTQVFEIGDTVTFDHHGHTLEGIVYGRIFVGPSATDFVYTIDVDGWVGPFTIGAHQIKNSTHTAYDRAMKGI